MFQFDVSFRVHIDGAGSLVQSGDYENGNSGIAGLSPTWDWLCVSNLKTLKIVTKDKLLSFLTTNVYHKFLECFKWFFCVIF